MNTRLSFLALLAALIPAASLDAQIVHVDSSASGSTHDGSSWCDAYLTLHDALAVVLSGDTIRVANGIYRPDETALNPNGTGNRSATFRLLKGVTIEGGYAGCGASVPDNRDIVLNETVLSGDLAGNDGPDFANNAENSFHVLKAISVDATAVVDGFTVKAGNASMFFEPYDDQGGGLLVLKGNPRIAQCKFVSNSAEVGGAVFFLDAAPTFEDCIFMQNVTLQPYAMWASGSGGSWPVAT